MWLQHVLARWAVHDCLFLFSFCPTCHCRKSWGCWKREATQRTVLLIALAAFECSSLSEEQAFRSWQVLRQAFLGLLKLGRQLFLVPGRCGHHTMHLLYLTSTWFLWHLEQAAPGPPSMYASDNNFSRSGLIHIILAFVLSPTVSRMCRVKLPGIADGHECEHNVAWCEWLYIP